ncbi:hypothetical protein JR316_0002685 [Psilocybe cubensis]|uniref:Uncharacterized protein n=2 Tax=Psilocybe cubensis TaxID=181762 RepID=A0A8H7Y3N9_PSICU|nr:hypothetical protein JR316_0002685 [Psilocybe cubensis]KAH9485770.1 hypothetical protein JR316_0002685 [Psilocybe cubensis]
MSAIALRYAAQTVGGATEGGDVGVSGGGEQRPDSELVTGAIGYVSSCGAAGVGVLPSLFATLAARTRGLPFGGAKGVFGIFLIVMTGALSIIWGMVQSYQGVVLLSMKDSGDQRDRDEDVQTQENPILGYI